MRNVVFGACVAMALTAMVSAQDKMDMGKMDHMAMQKSYSGCLEEGGEGHYSLTHVMAADTMKKPMMKKSGSTKKSDGMMKDDSMKHDSMMKDDAMGKESMAPASIGLSASGVDLSKHVGHKVTVTGTDGDAMNGMATFTVKSLKMTGKTCG